MTKNGGGAAAAQTYSQVVFGTLPKQFFIKAKSFCFISSEDTVLNDMTEGLKHLCTMCRVSSDTHTHTSGNVETPLT